MKRKHREFAGVIELLCILIVMVVVTQIYSGIKIHGTVKKKQPTGLNQVPFLALQKTQQLCEADIIHISQIRMQV